MLNKILFGFCLSLLCVACTSEITRLKETEYLRTHPTKPVAYPAGVDQPAQEKTYVIPELPKPSPEQTTAAEAPELLVLPPKLAGVDTSEDAEGEETKKSEEEEAAELEKEEEEGFLDTD
jgi:uncharacterized lipoprotein